MGTRNPVQMSSESTCLPPLEHSNADPSSRQSPSSPRVQRIRYETGKCFREGEQGLLFFSLASCFFNIYRHLKTFSSIGHCNQSVQCSWRTETLWIPQGDEKVSAHLVKYFNKRDQAVGKRQWRRVLVVVDEAGDSAVWIKVRGLWQEVKPDDLPVSDSEDEQNLHFGCKMSVIVSDLFTQYCLIILFHVCLCVLDMLASARCPSAQMPTSFVRPVILKQSISLNWNHTAPGKHTQTHTSTLIQIKINLYLPLCICVLFFSVHKKNITLIWLLQYSEDKSRNKQRPLLYWWYKATTFQ